MSLLPRLLVGAGVAPLSSLGWRCRCRYRRSSTATTRTSRSRSWFSTNADPGGSSRSRSRRWWSDDQLDLDVDDDEFDPWFSKVWNAYGYVLPLVLASMLVVTGPQAFLMAMAIPLAQSAISFLLRYAFAPLNQDYYDDDDGYYDVDSWEASALNEEPEPAESAEDATTTTKTNKSVASDGGFGGWDELDDTIKPEQEQEFKGIRRRKQRASSAHGRRRSSIRYREAPMLMRLLVAVFPFLGSWFRML